MFDAEALRRAKACIRDRQDWTQGTFFRDVRGADLCVGSPGDLDWMVERGLVGCCCVRGALYLVTGVFPPAVAGDMDGPWVVPGERTLEIAAQELFGPEIECDSAFKQTSASLVNDWLGFRDTHRMLNWAIAIAEGK